MCDSEEYILGLYKKPVEQMELEELLDALEVVNFRMGGLQVGRNAYREKELFERAKKIKERIFFLWNFQKSRAGALRQTKEFCMESEIIAAGKLAPCALEEWLERLRGEKLLDYYLSASSLARVVAPECTDKSKLYSALSKRLEQRIREELDRGQDFYPPETEADTFAAVM